MYLFSLGILYGLLIFLIEFGIKKNRHRVKYSKQITPKQNSSTFLSILIPFHNEIDSLKETFESLKNQTLDAKDFQVIWINDRSNDGGDEYLKVRLGETGNHLLVDIDEKNIVKSSGKRNALKKGIEKSAGNILIFSDADCSYPEYWLKNILQLFKTGDIDIYGGPVEKKTSGLVGIMLKWEQFLNNKIAESFYGFKSPVLTFGANWGIKKELFNTFNGYKGTEKTLSGDDDLLVQKLSRHKKKAIWHKGNTVETKGPPNWRSLWRQKRRHLSAGKSYNLVGSLFFAYLNLINLAFIIVLFFSKWAFLLLFFKFITDSIWLNKKNNLGNIKNCIWEVIIFDLYFVFINWIIGIISFVYPAKRW